MSRHDRMASRVAMRRGDRFVVSKRGASLSYEVAMPGGWKNESVDLPVGTEIEYLGALMGWGSDSLPADAFKWKNHKGEFEPKAGRLGLHADMSYLEPVMEEDRYEEGEWTASRYDRMAASVAGTMAEFSVVAVRHPDGAVETQLVVHGGPVVSAEDDGKLYEKCFEGVKSLITRATRRPKPKSTGTMKWGFDTTDFGTAANFAKVLAAAGISASREPARGSMGEFVWKGSGCEVVTGNNPITGEYMRAGGRQPEKGYASYVGVEGSPDKVEAVVAAIRKYGDQTEESPNARDFI